MQGRNGFSDREDGLADTVGEGESAMNGQSGIDIYAVPCVKQMAHEKFLYNRGSSAWCSVMTQRGGIRGGGKLKRR